jgi:arsenate reductase-like glutaredoxin family protein
MTQEKSASEVVIYHNARCSKSRSACEIVAGKGIEARIVEYLKTPPSREELRGLHAMGKDGVAFFTETKAVRFTEEDAGKTVSTWDGTLTRD